MQLPSPVITARPCTAITEETHQVIHLPANQRLYALHYAADQDGWDGEVICRMPDDLHIAIHPENLETTGAGD